MSDQRLDIQDHLYNPAVFNSPISAARIQDFLESLPVISLSDLPEGTQCPICIEPFEDAPDAEKPVKLPCKHVIGHDCLKKWLTSSALNRNNKHCPTCRAALFERNYGARPQVEERGNNGRNFRDFLREHIQLREAIPQRRRDFQREYDQLRETITHPRPEYQILRDQNERIQVRIAVLGERTEDSAVSLAGQESIVTSIETVVGQNFQTFRY